MTHKATPGSAFAEAIRMVRTTPECSRSIANRALLAYNLSTMDQPVPSGLWSSTETFARRQVDLAARAHALTCVCITADAKHALAYRQIPLPEMDKN